MEREKRLGREKEKRGIWKVAFWNVAGVKRKDDEFWRGLTEWDVIVMCETWVEQKEWEAVEGGCPKDIYGKSNGPGGNDYGCKEFEVGEGGGGGKEGIMAKKVKIGGGGR